MLRLRCYLLTLLFGVVAVSGYTQGLTIHSNIYDYLSIYVFNVLSRIVNDNGVKEKCLFKFRNWYLIYY